MIGFPWLLAFSSGFQTFVKNDDIIECDMIRLNVLELGGWSVFEKDFLQDVRHNL